MIKNRSVRIYCVREMEHGFPAGREVRSDTKRKTDSRGMTLVELIVTFAVAAIFMTAAAMLVVPAMKMTLHVKGMNRVHDDAAIIMETIVNELSYADSYVDQTAEGETLISAIQLTEKCDDSADSLYNGWYQKVSYSDKGGNPAVMCVTSDTDPEGKDRLQISYSEIRSDDGNNTPIRDEVNWSYGKGMYRDNEIRLGFRKKTAENIITVKLTVTNLTSGYSYTQETDVRCMNVEESGIKEE